MRRHGRLETITNPDGTFHLRLKAANGRILMHSEQLTGRQIRRAKEAIYGAFRDADYALMDEWEREYNCPACAREAKR